MKTNNKYDIISRMVNYASLLVVIICLNIAIAITSIVLAIEESLFYLSLLLNSVLLVFPTLAISGRIEMEISDLIDEIKKDKTDE